MPDPGRFDREFRRLRRSWAERLEEWLQEIDAAARPVIDPGGDTPRPESLRHLLHRLVGSGGSFGFAAVSEAARSAENLVDRLLRESRTATADEKAELRRHLGTLRRASAEATHTAAGQDGGEDGGQDRGGGGG